MGIYQSWRWSKHFKKMEPGTFLESNKKLILQCDMGYEPMGRDEDEIAITCDKGDWLEDASCVPAKCRSPPPSIENGQVSNYTNEHGSEVVYNCLSDFEETKYGNVTCLYGEWKGDTPICSGTRCRSDPPKVDNGHVTSVDTEHGGAVVYDCAEGFEKMNHGNVICQFGEWEGHPPTCTENNCYFNDLRFSNGMLAPSKDPIKSGESIKVECDSGFSRITISSINLSCSKGKWTGNEIPPCIENSCYFKDLEFSEGILAPSSDPTNGGEAISVTCASGFSRINVHPYCVKGIWAEYGKSPCRESHCYVTKVENGVITRGSKESETNASDGRVREYEYDEVYVGDMINDGDSLYVTCNDNYSFQGKNMNNVRINCTKGSWEPKPDCSPRKYCLVEEIENGAITSRKRLLNDLAGRIFNEFSYSKVRVGEIIYDEEFLFVTCDHNFSFQGKRDNNIAIKCTKGLWEPKPICSPPGTTYEKKEESEAAVTNNVISPFKASLQTVSSTATEQQTLSRTLSSVPVQTESDLKKTDENCFCTYKGPENVIAYTGNKRLNDGSKIQPNGVVKFRCNNFGYDRLNGSTEIVCKDCKNWHSSEYPVCVPPSLGDAILVFYPMGKILPSDILALDQGGNVKIACSTNGVEALPTWSSNVSNEHWRTQNSFVLRNGQRSYSSVLEIQDAGSQHNGKYSCGGGNGSRRNNTIHIQVKGVPGCGPLITLLDSQLIVFPLKDNYKTGELVYFRCLGGLFLSKDVESIRCLSKGWSQSELPTCVESLENASSEEESFEY